MNWIADGWPVGHADIAPIICMRTASEAILRRLPHLDPSLIKVPISERARRSFAFWLEFFQSWDRTLVVVQDFGPCSTWQVFGRTDASTEWGHGGFAMSSSSFVFLNAPWSPAERPLSRVVRALESSSC